MYAYVGDNPTSVNDPSGLDWVTAGSCYYDEEPQTSAVTARIIGGSAAPTAYTSYPGSLSVVNTIGNCSGIADGDNVMPAVAPDTTMQYRISNQMLVAAEQSFADCVKNLANVDSIQNLTHAGNGFLARAFLSNTISSFIQLGQDFSASRLGASGNDMARVALSKGLGPLLKSAARNVPNVTVSATAVSVAASENGVSASTTTATATLSLGNLAQGAVGVLSDIFTGKAIYDAGVAVGAAAVCSIPGIR